MQIDADTKDLIDDLRARLAEVERQLARLVDSAAPPSAAARAQAHVPRLLAEIGSDDPTVRSDAIEHLIDLGAAGVAALGELVRHGGVRERRLAAVALGDIGSSAASATPALIAALKDLESGVRRAVAQSLGKLGSDAREAVPALTEMAHRDPDAGSRLRAALAVARSTGDASSVIDTIVEGTHEEDAAVRLEVARILGSLAAVRERAVPVLARLLGDPEWRVRRAAAWSLASVRPTPEVIPALVLSLGDPEWGVRKSAAWALGHVIGQHPDVVRALAERLHDPESEVRYWAVQALGSLGDGANAALPALLAATGDPDHQVRARAASTLGRIGAGHPMVAAALRQRVRDAVDAVREASIQALGSLGVDDPETVAVLATMFDDPSSAVRLAAAQAVATVGAAARAVLPQLEVAAADDESEWVRLELSTFIAQLRPLAPAGAA